MFLVRLPQSVPQSAWGVEGGVRGGVPSCHLDQTSTPKNPTSDHDRCARRTLRDGAPGLALNAPIERVMIVPPPKTSPHHPPAMSLWRAMVLR